MSAWRWASAGLALLLLALVWFAPMPISGHFTAHMVVHLTVVAVAAPLLALSLHGTRLDPVGNIPALFSPITASIAELLVVWGWHVPLLHQMARASTAAFVAEQGSFLAVGMLLWLSALGGAGRRRAASGVLALLFTSMHMTLLAVLLALAQRPLFVAEPPAHASVIEALADQQTGALLMLAIGTTAYLVGGLGLLTRLLARESNVPLEVNRQ